MRNQWFGDKNDYLKYSVIRHLAKGVRLPVAICWMMNPNSRHPDPSATRYLAKNPELAKYDHEVFCYLKEQVIDKKTLNVATMASGGPIQGCTFFFDEVPDYREQRSQYLNEFLQQTRASSLLFFDPDTGIETKTRSYGEELKKFILWEELKTSMEQGHSLLIYQHLSQMRSQQDSLLIERMQDAIQNLETKNVFAIRADRVAFVLVTQPTHTELLRDSLSEVARVWEDWGVVGIWL